MPTKKHRFSYTPEPHILEALERLRGASGWSFTELINQQLDPTVDHLHAMADHIEELNELASQTAQVVRSAGASADAEVRHGVKAVADAFSNLRAAADAAKPPSSNTGATSPRGNRRRAA